MNISNYTIYDDATALVSVKTDINERLLLKETLDYFLSNISFGNYALKKDGFEFLYDLRWVLEHTNKLKTKKEMQSYISYMSEMMKVLVNDIETIRLEDIDYS